MMCVVYSDTREMSCGCDQGELRNHAKELSFASMSHGAKPIDTLALCDMSLVISDLCLDLLHQINLWVVGVLG